MLLYKGKQRHDIPDIFVIFKNTSTLVGIVDQIHLGNCHLYIIFRQQTKVRSRTRSCFYFDIIVFAFGCNKVCKCITKNLISTTNTSRTKTDLASIHPASSQACADHNCNSTKNRKFLLQKYHLSLFICSLSCHYFNIKSSFRKVSFIFCSKKS